MAYGTPIAAPWRALFQRIRAVPGVFFLVVAGTVERLGVGASFALAVAADLLSNGGSLWALRRIRAARA